MPDVRITQDVVEFLTTNTVPVRETQDVIEFLSPVIISVRSTQDVVETLAVIPAPVRSTQDIIEILIPEAPDVSGVYFINTRKTEAHDSFYNGVEGKIPDPTVRLALLGD